MFTFVKTDVHPRLAELAQLYERLDGLTTIATEAARTEKQAANDIKTMTEEQKKVEAKLRKIFINGVSSADVDFSAPEWSGHSPEYIKRMAKHACALLQARAVYEPLYAATCEMQRFVGNEMNLWHEIYKANVPRWAQEIFWLDMGVSKELLHKSLTALSSYSDWVEVEWYDELPPLKFDEGDLIGAFNRQYSNWLRSIPELPTAQEWPNRGQRRLLVKALGVSDKVDNQLDKDGKPLSAQTCSARQLITSDAAVQAVKDLFTKLKWIVSSKIEISRDDRRVVLTLEQRPHNSNRPFSRSESPDKPKRRGLWSR